MHDPRSIGLDEKADFVIADINVCMNVIEKRLAGRFALHIIFVFYYRLSNMLIG